MFEFRKKVKSVLLVFIFLFLFLVFFFISSWFIYKGALIRNDVLEKQPYNPNSGLNSPEEREWIRCHSQTIRLQSKDGLWLNTYEMTPYHPSHTWVIVVHGYRIDALSLDFIRLFYEKGFNVLAPDLKSHGKSEGQYIGMGFKDKEKLVIQGAGHVMSHKVNPSLYWQTVCGFIKRYG